LPSCNRHTFEDRNYSPYKAIGELGVWCRHPRPSFRRNQISVTCSRKL
jgi:hypothetical protein